MPVCPFDEMSRSGNDMAGAAPSPVVRLHLGGVDKGDEDDFSEQIAGSGGAGLPPESAYGPASAATGPTESVRPCPRRSQRGGTRR